LLETFFQIGVVWGQIDIDDDSREKKDMLQKLTVEIINAAIAGFEQQKGRIEQQIADLRAMLPTGRIEAAITVNGSRRKRRRMSAAGKRAIAEAQRKRWAALKGRSEGEAPAPAPAKRKRRLSAAGRAAIIAATKKRWALKHAAEAATAKKASTRTKAVGKKGAVKAPAAKAA
jgi:hypothetical protein